MGRGCSVNTRGGGGGVGPQCSERSGWDNNGRCKDDLKNVYHFKTATVDRQNDGYHSNENTNFLKRLIRHQFKNLGDKICFLLWERNQSIIELSARIFPWEPSSLNFESIQTIEHTSKMYPNYDVINAIFYLKILTQRNSSCNCSIPLQRRGKMIRLQTH